MAHFTRRSTLTAAASTGFALLLPDWANAQAPAPAPRTRYSAQSPQGKMMLKQYARAVDIMMNMIPKGDPRHWDFQWYSHWIPGPQSPWPSVIATKNQALQSVYQGRPPTDPQRKLAEAMWDGCQAHGNNPGDPTFYQEQFFLPWHRYFVFYFEEIIRGVLPDTTFTLPYWDYIGGPASSAAIPPEFTDPASPLYRGNRNQGVNNGQPIDAGRNRLDLNSFKETAYLKSTPQGDVGFCPILDFGLHGAVHVDVGNGTNMARVPYAGGDPIFWLHHCNLDRLWESWNRLPNRSNPAWPNRSFTFANANGGAVSAPVAGADRVALLNYQYDNYYVPAGIPTSSTAPATPFSTGAASPSEVKAIVQTPIALGSTPVRAELIPPSPPLAGPFTLKLALPAGNRNLYLILGGIEVHADPGAVAYDVFLDLPAGSNPKESAQNYAGSLNFFHVTENHDHDGGGHSAAFNVTDVVNGLQAAGRLSERPSVTLVPIGTPNAEAMPVVRDVALVEA